LIDEKGFVIEIARSKARQKNHISEANSKNSTMPEGAAHFRNISSSDKLSTVDERLGRMVT
jgi:molybdopterin-biosynthesis enzyme MoeA-like protein